MYQEIEVNKTGLNYVFRYRSDSKFAIDEIKRNYIYFPNSEQLNDPFDASHKLLKVRLKKENYEEYLNIFLPHLNEKRVLEYFKKIFPTTKELETFISENLQGFMSRFGIACFSISPVNFMLWANYAHNHQGICIQYNTDFDEDFFKRLRPVEYVEEFEALEIDLNSGFENFESALHRKIKLWKEEYEIRLIKEKTGELKLNPLSMRSIIFGLRAENKFKEMIINVVKEFQPHIKIYDTKLMEDGFGLSLDEIIIL